MNTPQHLDGLSLPLLDSSNKLLPCLETLSACAICKCSTYPKDFPHKDLHPILQNKAGGDDLAN